MNSIFYKLAHDYVKNFSNSLKNDKKINMR